VLPNVVNVSLNLPTNLATTPTTAIQGDANMANSEGEARLVIEGISEDNQRFRPSDWSQRIAANWARFGVDNRLKYSPSLFPCTIEGVPCLIIARDLETRDPEAYRYVMEFATENRLRVREDRRQQQRTSPTSEQRADNWNYTFFSE
jgi:hypothetical protein